MISLGLLVSKIISTQGGFTLICCGLKGKS